MSDISRRGIIVSGLAAAGGLALSPALEAGRMRSVSRGISSTLGTYSEPTSLPDEDARAAAMLAENPARSPMLENLVHGNLKNVAGAPMPIGGVRATAKNVINEATDKIGAEIIMALDCMNEATIIAFSEYSGERATELRASRPLVTNVIVNDVAGGPGMAHFLWRRNRELTYLVEDPNHQDLVGLDFRKAISTDYMPLELALDNLKGSDSLKIRSWAGQAGLNPHYDNGMHLPGVGLEYAWMRSVIGVDAGQYPILTVQPVLGPVPADEHKFLLTAYRTGIGEDGKQGRGEATKALTALLTVEPIDPVEGLKGDQAVLKVLSREGSGEYAKIWLGGHDRATKEPARLWGVDNDPSHPDESRIYLPEARAIARGIHEKVEPRVGHDNLRLMYRPGAGFRGV